LPLLQHIIVEVLLHAYIEKATPYPYDIGVHQGWCTRLAAARLLHY